MLNTAWILQSEMLESLCRTKFYPGGLEKKPENGYNRETVQSKDCCVEWGLHSA